MLKVGKKRKKNHKSDLFPSIIEENENIAYLAIFGEIITIFICFSTFHLSHFLQSYITVQMSITLKAVVRLKIPANQAKPSAQIGQVCVFFNSCSFFVSSFLYSFISNCIGPWPLGHQYEGLLQGGQCQNKQVY